ncbi:WD40-repeat-containing domain protein [Ganoderma leucocontextum]|nr:WD40-repeat-containing domain protein [Ganoderma leucocontextum]
MVVQYQQLHLLEEGHTKGIAKVAFSSNTLFVATAGLDGRVCIWDMETGELKYVFVGSSPVLSLLWIPAGDDLVICGLADGNIACMDIGGPESIEANGFFAHYQPVEHLALRDEYLASGACQDVSVWRWDMATSKYILDHAVDHPPTTSHNAWQEILVTSVQWVSPPDDAPLLVVTYMNHGIVIYNATTWVRTRAFPINGQIASATVSEDGTRIAISNVVRGFDIYSLRTGAPLCSLDQDMRRTFPTPVLWIHGGLALLGGTTTGQLTLWDVMDVDEKGKGKGDQPLGPRVLYRLALPEHAMSLAIAAHYDNQKDQFFIAAGIMNIDAASPCLVWKAIEGVTPSLHEDSKTL